MEKNKIIEDIQKLEDILLHRIFGNEKICDEFRIKQVAKLASKYIKIAIDNRETIRNLEDRTAVLNKLCEDSINELQKIKEMTKEFATLDENHEDYYKNQYYN